MGSTVGNGRRPVLKPVSKANSKPIPKRPLSQGQSTTTNMAPWIERHPFVTIAIVIAITLLTIFALR